MRGDRLRLALLVCSWLALLSSIAAIVLYAASDGRTAFGRASVAGVCAVFVALNAARISRISGERRPVSRDRYDPDEPLGGPEDC